MYLMRFVVLKRPGFQSQKYRMPNYTPTFWQSGGDASPVSPI